MQPQQSKVKVFSSLLFQTNLKDSSRRERRGHVKIVSRTKWNFPGKNIQADYTNTPTFLPLPSLNS